ncbi:hypothetical protein BG000_006178 [Podila horticola]|nr:hypothetical protein BG000_006178 [Podila horticola]
MLANKTLRPLFIAAAAAIMLLATVEAAPAAGTAHKISNTISCVVCDDPPVLCNLRCPGGYCDINYCTCRPMCKKGVPP